MDIIELLEQDHRTVDELFRRFNLSDQAESQKDLGKKIVHELSVHAAVEEQFVYPLIRTSVDGGGELANHSIEEHSEVKRLLSDIEKQEAGSSEYTTTMNQVIESVRHHVEEEQNEIFPKLREATDAEKRAKVGELVDKAKGLVPTHPHPLVPGTATAQLVAGPWATVVDKIRDLVEGATADR
jgi:hemerythrin superfamily protein